MINISKIALMLLLVLIGLFHLYFNQDISTNISKSREISRIYKNAISLDDKHTSALIFNLRDDGKITLSEYNEIIESYKSYSNSASPSLDQSISKAEQREHEFMKRKYQTQENVASFPLVQ
ncbi:hypothetical protein N5C10_10270 [Acinetobacter johnsonii]|uniref:Uncharacterized protein n=1 Tax=Acinetobacter johnsonii TaxID=40214 RepID=A0AA42SSR4_ACIJO|nr:hypothetical protein [Acinetobacter johnsonii]MDH0969621.1 hypothetical protein [Acinetobacter johnsonii]